MNQITINLPKETDTAALGFKFAPLLEAGDVICLSGPLGVGKTTLARAMIKAFSGVEEVPSPTFTLVEIYQGAGLALWHFDLYRLERKDEIWELGFEDALVEGVSVIEWPERIIESLPASSLVLKLEVTAEGRKAIIISGPKWRERLLRAGIQ